MKYIPQMIYVYSYGKIKSSDFTVIFLMIFLYFRWYTVHFFHRWYSKLSGFIWNSIMKHILAMKYVFSDYEKIKIVNFTAVFLMIFLWILDGTPFFKDYSVISGYGCVQTQHSEQKLFFYFTTDKFDAIPKQIHKRRRLFAKYSWCSDCIPLTSCNRNIII